jgi:hypothetical protein
MPVALALAFALGQHPYGEPPQELLRAEPDAAFVGGEWRMLGPLPARNAGRDDSAMSRAALAAMRAGTPWPALDEPFAVPGALPLLWRDAELAAIADAAAAEFVHPRARRGIETGRVELERLAVLDADARARAALFYRPVHARADARFVAELRAGGDTRLWINGRLAGAHPDGDALGATLCELELVQGLNHLLIETASPRASEWWFELRHRHELTQADVDRAIDSGVHFLLTRQQADGHWPWYAGYRSGSTALALLALLKSELPRNHLAAQRALAALRRDPPDQTYSLALALLAVHAFGDPAHDEWIEEMAGDLVEWQQGNGLWGYPSGEGDLSNTQFAALALHAAAQRGVEIPRETWRELVQATLACRTSAPTGASGRAQPLGFGYHVEGAAYASMTAAGVATLQIGIQHLGEESNRRARVALDAGLEWLGEHCALHPTLGHGDGWTTYMLYGLERAGALTRQERFGVHPWYAEGAAWLLERQRGNGAWTQGSGADVDTAFALLFLTRATAKAAVTQPGGDDGAGRLFASSASDGPLLLRAAVGPALDLWVDAASPDFRRYARVIYWLRGPGGAWESFPGGASKRFDARVTLDRPGLWQARASAFLHDGSSLGSGTIEIVHESAAAAPSPAGSAVGADPAANLLRAGACTAQASSAGRDAAPGWSCDQAPATRWLCASDDPAPWLELQPERRARGNLVVLRPAAWQEGDAEQQPEPARVRVVVNGAEARVVDLPEVRPAQWVVDFGAALEIRTLRIEVLAVRRGRLGACSVGFAEVEVHEAATVPQ